MKKKYFASKFKSTLHNLAANSITSQMELERTTHAKVVFEKKIDILQMYKLEKYHWYDNERYHLFASTDMSLDSNQLILTY